MENLSNNKRTTPEPNRFSYTNISEDQKYELGDNLSLINWASEKLEPFQKNFYIVFFYNCFIFLLKEHESVKNRSHPISMHFYIFFEIIKVGLLFYQDGTASVSLKPVVEKLLGMPYLLLFI